MARANPGSMARANAREGLGLDAWLVQMPGLEKVILQTRGRNRPGATIQLRARGTCHSCHT